ncbi:MAG: hypothetical protein ACMUIU_16005 [bacterium]
MFSNKINILIVITIIVFLSLIISSMVQCQYWTALPPYNTLWPLWSPALSPVNPTTGLPTPIVTSLTPSTILPVQPGLTWDPITEFPWLLYNSPFNTLIFFDTIFGINPWPPSNYVSYGFNYINATPTGNFIPINLPVNYSALPPTDPAWILSTVPLVNDYYAASYQYYINNANSISPLFPVLPPGFTLPALLPSFLDSLVTAPISSSIIIPPVLSASAILGI